MHGVHAAPKVKPTTPEPKYPSGLCQIDAPLADQEFWLQHAE